MSDVLYPYHPRTGLRLATTIDLIPAAVHQDISKVDGQIQYEDSSTGSTMHWDKAQRQMQGGETFFADPDGVECLSDQVVWSSIDAECIAIAQQGNATSVVMANELRDQLQKLAFAANEVVRALPSAESTSALRSVLQQLDLLDEGTPVPI